MKKKILGLIAIVAIAAAVALNVNMKTNDYGLSDLSLNNVEALAVKQKQCYTPENWTCCCNMYENAANGLCPCGE